MATSPAKFVRNDERLLERTVIVCPLPTDQTANASYALTWSGGKLTQIDKTVTDENGSRTYRRTLTYTGTDLTAISVWSVL